MEFLPESFAPMCANDQFIIYKLVDKPNTDKKNKVPVCPITDIAINPLEQNNWVSYKDACEILATKQRPGYGIGFVFTENDPFWFLDIDDCYDGNSWSSIAIELINQFPGCAVEISSSGKGLHLFFSANKNINHTSRRDDLNIELYSHGRFCALTGTQAYGDPSFNAGDCLLELIKKYFTADINTRDLSSWTNAPEEDWGGIDDDDELIKIASSSNSVSSIFGGKASFSDLFNANVEQLALAFPSKTDQYNRSSADAALAMRLAYWTGRDCERIKTLMYRSGLARKKWERESYIHTTILKACAKQTQYPKKQITPELNTGGVIRPQLISSATFLTVEQQIELFTGCVYVCDDHQVLVPGGTLLNNERFDVMYGGYSMIMDARNEKVSRSAWEAFTKSQAFRAPRVHSTCFKPKLAEGTIVEEDGQYVVNIYSPIKTARKQGDPEPFLTHLEKIAPDERDRTILTSYLAGCVQFIGEKFQWCPYIQGVEGNGKTLLSKCVAFAVGQRYSHFPKASDISGKYNGWEYKKIFIGVDDIYLPESNQEIIEAIKPMITGDVREVEPKFKDKVSKELCHNFILNSNHKDGIRKIRNDRRFAPFYTPQQCVADLKAWGMDDEYFFNFFKWLSTGGFAIVNEFLHTYEIPEEFGLRCLKGRAPRTTSTESAIEYGASSVEQEIIEVIDQGLIGFKNGWVSSIALDRLLERSGASRKLSYTRRKQLLENLGYMWHPGLTDGRVNRAVSPDNAKTRLYITHSHYSRGLRDANAIAKSYEDDQK